MRGKIISTAGGVYAVYSKGVYYNVFPKGIFRHQHKNLLVGDNVTIDDENNVILDIDKRINELIRPKAANIDQIFVTLSLKEPDLSKELLFKFLTYVNMNGINAKVILTKADLLDNLNDIQSLLDELKSLSIDAFLISKKDKKSIESIRCLLNGKTSIFLGQTGVGKSSLINMIDESYERKIGSYSISRGRGKHQTKEVILLPYNDGFIGDTPGFSALDLGIFKEDLAEFFPGYNSLYVDCYFSDCLHLNEKNCKVKEAIENGVLSKESYEIYTKLLSELPFKKERYK